MKFINYLLIIIFVAIIGALIFWLWQRQPKTIVENKPEKTQTSVENKKDEKDASVFLLGPKDGEIFDANTVKFSGKTGKENKIILISNSTSDIASVKADGTFEITQILPDGINLISIIAIDKDFKEVQKQAQTLYIQTTETKDKNVVAGLVSKIFENTLTVTTSNGEINVNKTANTAISTPKQENAKPTPSPKVKEADIRVGDYIVALGIKTKDTDMVASSIQVIRDNKPQITKKYAPIKFASATKLKIFSGNNLLDNKLMEFKLDKINIFDSDKKSDEKAIVKDKRAIIFYTPTGSDNIASLIYILP